MSTCDRSFCNSPKWRMPLSGGHVAFLRLIPWLRRMSVIEASGPRRAAFVSSSASWASSAMASCQASLVSFFWPQNFRNVSRLACLIRRMSCSNMSRPCWGGRVALYSTLFFWRRSVQAPFARAEATLPACVTADTKLRLPSAHPAFKSLSCTHVVVAAAMNFAPLKNCVRSSLITSEQAATGLSLSSSGGQTVLAMLIKTPALAKNQRVCEICQMQKTSSKAFSLGSSGVLVIGIPATSCKSRLAAGRVWLGASKAARRRSA
mmetsp:Transcript_19115/g.52021  ORF Transcript_19115/g.52021 Transcript_19115/m.52021 type:complete len:263 (+) Transcript_19115:151-939(+)